MPTDKEMAQFCYSMLRQLDLKIIDWNEVARRHHITNGHAARMRFSRFRQQMEGTLPRRLPTGNPRGRPRRHWGEEEAYNAKAGGKRLDAKGMPESDDEDVPIWLVSEQRKRRLRAKGGKNSLWPAFKSEPWIKADPMQAVPPLPTEARGFHPDATQPAMFSFPSVASQHPFENVQPTTVGTEVVHHQETAMQGAGHPVGSSASATFSPQMERKPILPIVDQSSTNLSAASPMSGSHQESTMMEHEQQDAMPAMKLDPELQAQAMQSAMYAPHIKPEITDGDHQQAPFHSIQMPLVGYEYPQSSMVGHGTTMMPQDSRSGNTTGEGAGDMRMDITYHDPTTERERNSWM